jgi:hypothetical protein
MAVVRAVTHVEAGDEIVVVRDRRAWAAAGLSVLWPGFGHAYLGRTAAAVGFVVAQVLVVVLSVVPGAWRFTLPVWAVLVVVAAVSAWRAARQAATP